MRYGLGKKEGVKKKEKSKARMVRNPTIHEYISKRNHLATKQGGINTMYDNTEHLSASLWEPVHLVLGVIISIFQSEGLVTWKNGPTI